MTLEERARQWLAEGTYPSNVPPDGNNTLRAYMFSVSQLTTLLREVRREALEEAARAADRIKAEDRWDPNGDFAWAAEMCADVIRDELMDDEGGHG